MAQAGLLDGKEATTYWRFFREFGERFPKVLLNQEKHLSDADNLYCAGGITSACDLYIYLIERFCGASIAQAVSRDILYEVQRSYAPGRIGFGGQKLHQDVTILQIQHWLEEHFADKFRFEDVARDHGMSIRNFMRRFQAATGDKPLHYLQRLRIEQPRASYRRPARASRPSATKWVTTTPASSPDCFASTPISPQPVPQAVPAQGRLRRPSQGWVGRWRQRIMIRAWSPEGCPNLFRQRYGG